MVRKISLILAFSICLLLAIYATANQNGEEVTICEFVQEFKIVNRPRSITKDHKKYIRELPYFGKDTIEAIEKHLPIVKISDLNKVEPLGEKRKFILRVFFSLEGDHECFIDSRTPKVVEDNNTDC